MVTIIVKDLINNYSDNESGLVVFEVIKKQFEAGQKVTVSFDSVSYVSTSFVNSAFINLLHDYTFAYIKEHLKFTNSNVQINSLIKDRFSFETKKATVA